MKIIFHLSGTTVFETDMDHVPAAGSLISFRINSYMKGYGPGTLIEFIVGGVDDPVSYHLEEGLPPRISISVNGFTTPEISDS